MLGPHGILSLRDDLKHAFDCDIQAIQIAAKVQAADGREEITTVAVRMNPEELEIPTKKPCILASPKEADVKKINLGTGDPEKTATISAHLSAK
jgi:rhamnose utilization protein RhaD (predicted bifunctional aldolase and dehydrogenase)